MFKVININPCLSLCDRNFSDCNFNIDYLAARLCEDIRLEEKLSIATSCINLGEKFHSYFHFEESYFHLLLAKELGCKSELYVGELEAAIFQDPFNYEAKKLLAEILPEGDERLNDHRFCGDLRDEIYDRYCPSYRHFLEFACCVMDYDEPPVGSYWHNFNEYECSGDIKLLQSTVELVSMSHKLYHSEAAKLYYNRYVILNALGCDVLAKNDLLKARNLNPQVV